MDNHLKQVSKQTNNLNQSVNQSIDRSINQSKLFDSNFEAFEVLFVSFQLAKTVLGL